MHVVLTDAVTCPRCGPDWGLILIADRTEQRRILEGAFACANCHARFAVTNGFCNLGDDAMVQASSSAEDALRMAALLGVTQGPALLMIVGAGAGNAAAIADMIEAVEVVAVTNALAHDAERPGVSRFAASGTLPFRSGSMRGVALTDPASFELIEHAARVVAPRGRVVVLSGDPALAERLEQAGLRVVARDASASVAERTSI